MKIVFQILIFLCVFNVANARIDFSPPEYKQVVEILELPDKAITLERVDLLIVNALMETNRVWETNIFGQIRHGLNRENIKYSVVNYLALQFAEVFFHQNDIFTYKGQGFSITDNTRKLALDSFWDIANSRLETKHVFDIIEKKMFDITLMSMSDSKSELFIAEQFLKNSAKYMQKNSNNTHLELLALAIKNHLFNVYSSSDSSQVRSAAYELISLIIKKGSSLQLVSREYKRTLTDLSKSFSFQACRNMWN